MKNKKPNIRLWITIAVIALIIILFVVLVDVPAVLATLSKTDWRFAGIGAGALVLGLAAYALRWRLLLREKPGRLATFHAANVGHMVNTLIPLRAGEPARIVAIAQDPNVTIVEATSSFFVERILEQIMRLSALGGAVAFGVGLELSGGAIIGGVVFVGAALGGIVWMFRNQERIVERWPVAIARLPRVNETQAREKLSELITGLTTIASVKVFMLAFLWSLITWSLFWIFHYLSLLALGLDLPQTEILAMSMGALALAPPSAPTQPGIYHASVAAPLTLIGFDNLALTAYAVLLHAVQMVVMIGLGGWGLLQLGLKPGDLIGEPALQEVRVNP